MAWISGRGLWRRDDLFNCPQREKIENIDWVAGLVFPPEPSQPKPPKQPESHLSSVTLNKMTATLWAPSEAKGKWLRFSALSTLLLEKISFICGTLQTT